MGEIAMHAPTGQSVLACLFPGQGSQEVGMGRELAQAFPEARDVYGLVDEALQQHLGRLCFEGPAAELNLTENAQPAIMATSLAVVRVLERQGGWRVAERAHFLAGHSLGEYSALAAGGVLKVEETARLLKKRGQAMQAAVAPGKGAMHVVLGLELEALEAVVAEVAAQGIGICAIANDNAPGQAVLSGDRAAVIQASQKAKARGAKRCVELPVSAPFHSPLMEPAAKMMAEILKDFSFARLPCPLIANVTAAPLEEKERLPALLSAQVTARVRWRESLDLLAARGGTHALELGPRRVLSNLMKRCHPGIQTQAIGDPRSVEAFLMAI